MRAIANADPKPAYWLLEASRPYVAYGSGSVLVGMLASVNKSACTCTHFAATFLVAIGASGLA
jgi:hypothetical protein